jgi:hypothetical protein
VRRSTSFPQWAPTCCDDIWNVSDLSIDKLSSLNQKASDVEHEGELQGVY